MNEDIKRILDIFKPAIVLSILESKDKYIVSTCPDEDSIGNTTECNSAVDKKTFKVSEYSSYDNHDEYLEAWKNGYVYLYDNNKKQDVEHSSITPDTPVSELMHAMENLSEDELQHWGIIGMKWGVRRYQNKDGSLTAAGKKRRAKLEAELKTLKGPEKKISEMNQAQLDRYVRRKQSEEAAYILNKRVSELTEKTEPKEVDPDELKKAEREQKRLEKKAKREQKRLERKMKRAAKKNTGDTHKKISDMSDAELAEFIARKRAERDAYSLQSDISKFNPKHVSAGQQMIDNFKKSAVSPAIADAGKKFLTGVLDKAISKALGGDENPLKMLENEAKKAGFNKSIWDAAKAEEQYKQAQILTQNKLRELNSTIEKEKAAKRGKSWVESTTLLDEDWEW